MKKPKIFTGELIAEYNDYRLYREKQGKCWGEYCVMKIVEVNVWESYIDFSLLFQSKNMNKAINYYEKIIAENVSGESNDTPIEDTASQLLPTGD